MIDGVKALEDLIKIDTGVPPGKNYKEAMELLQPLFAEVGCQTEIVRITKKRGCQLAVP